jgi:hypothetical protein
MADPLRETDALPVQEAVDRDASPREVQADEEAAGYARADLEDALARIRGTIGAHALADIDSGQDPRRTSDDERRVLEEIRSLGDRVERLATVTEAAAERTTDLSSRAEERGRRLTDAIEKLQAAQDRADVRMRWLSVAVAVLAVILGASLVIDLL